MKTSAFKGASFGLTSGIITTLGMMVGLSSGTNSKLVVIGGIVSIALADSFSDALGIHVSEEADKKKTTSEVWLSTLATFLSKLIFSSLFIIPVLLFSLKNAIIVSVLAGMLLLGFLSYFIAIDNKEKPAYVISEHIFIAVLVVVITHYAGVLVSAVFG